MDQDNFQYWLKSEYKKTKYYECTKVEQKGCPVRLKYDESTDLVTSYTYLPYNHDSNILEGVVKNTTRSIVKAGENKKA